MKHVWRTTCRVVLGLLLTCTAAHAQSAPIEMTLQHLFAGRSEGNGELTMLFGKPQPFHVESHGLALPDGSFQLDQTVTFQGKPPEKRTWILQTVTPGVYAGTLSDAAGEVKGRTEGNRLILHYRIRGPLYMQQSLELMPDGKTIDNLGKVTLIGIPIGRLQETILRE